MLVDGVNLYMKVVLIIDNESFLKTEEHHQILRIISKGTVSFITELSVPLLFGDCFVSLNLTKNKY